MLFSWSVFSVRRQKRWWLSATLERKSRIRSCVSWTCDVNKFWDYGRCFIKSRVVANQNIICLGRKKTLKSHHKMSTRESIIADEAQKNGSPRGLSQSETSRTTISATPFTKNVPSKLSGHVQAKAPWSLPLRMQRNAREVVYRHCLAQARYLSHQFCEL